MSPDEIALSFIIPAICSLLFIRQWLRIQKRIMITDYQRGVRFADGRATGVLLPGSYRYNASKETVLTVDMRPQPLLIERFFYRDALNRSAVISLATDLLVADPAVAATTLKDQVNDSSAIVVDALRDFLSRRAGDSDRNSLGVEAERMTAVLNAELQRVGMRVNPVDITEAWVAPFSVSSAGVLTA